MDAANSYLRSTPSNFLKVSVMHKVIMLAVFCVFSAASQAKCICKCTSGYSDCFNISAKSCLKKSKSLKKCSCSHSSGSCPSKRRESVDAFKLEPLPDDIFEVNFSFKNNSRALLTKSSEE